MSFPESVQGLFRGDIGQPEGGWPEGLADIILKGQPAYTDRPQRPPRPHRLRRGLGRFSGEISRRAVHRFAVLAALPQGVRPVLAVHAGVRGGINCAHAAVFLRDAARRGSRHRHCPRQEHHRHVPLDEQAPTTEGHRTIFFSLNGQTRNIEVRDTSVEVTKTSAPTLKPTKGHPAAAWRPPPGPALAGTGGGPGQQVQRNEPLFIITRP